MQLNGRITLLEQAELESQVPGRPGEEGQGGGGKGILPRSPCPALRCCRTGSRPGSGNEGRVGC